MGRRRKPNRRKVTLHIDRDTYRRGRAVAELKNVKISDMVEDFLNEEIEKNLGKIGKALDDSG